MHSLYDVNVPSRSMNVRYESMGTISLVRKVRWNEKGLESATLDLAFSLERNHVSPTLTTACHDCIMSILMGHGYMRIRKEEDRKLMQST